MTVTDEMGHAFSGETESDFPGFDDSVQETEILTENMDSETEELGLSMVRMLMQIERSSAANMTMLRAQQNGWLRYILCFYSVLSVFLVYLLNSGIGVLPPAGAFVFGIFLLAAETFFMYTLSCLRSEYFAELSMSRRMKRLLGLGNKSLWGSAEKTPCVMREPDAEKDLWLSETEPVARFIPQVLLVLSGTVFCQFLLSAEYVYIMILLCFFSFASAVWAVWNDRRVINGNAALGDLRY